MSQVIGSRNPLLRVAVLLLVLITILLLRGPLGEVVSSLAPENKQATQAALQFCHLLPHENGEFENTWLGIRLQQFPNDLVLYEQLLERYQPDVVLELGTFHGGLTHYLSMLLDSIRPDARIVTVDIDAAPWRQTLAATPQLAPLRRRVDFIEGDTLAAATLAQVTAALGSYQRLLIIQDTVHTREHVLNELRAYQQLVPSGGYIVVNDMHHDLGSGRPGPSAGVHAFLATTRDFAVDESYNRFLAGTGLHDGFLRRRGEPPPRSTAAGATFAGHSSGAADGRDHR